MKYLKRILVILGILLVAIYLLGSLLNYVNVRKLADEKEYYKAYRSNIKWLIDFGGFNSNETLEFYDVMAHHYELDEKIEDEWILPDLTGWSCAEIAYALDNVGQSYEIEYMDDADFDYNSILRTEPEVGTETNPETVVKLYVNSFNRNNNNYSILASTIYISETGKWIILSDYHNVYKCNVNMSNKELIYENEFKDEGYAIRGILVSGDNIFIHLASGIKNSKLIEYDLFTNNYEEIYINKNMNLPYILGEDMIFFDNTNEELERYAMNTVTKDIRRIDDSVFRMYKDSNSLLSISNIENEWIVEEYNSETGVTRGIFTSTNVIYYIRIVGGKIYLLTNNYYDNHNVENKIIEIYEESINELYTLGEDASYHPNLLKWQNKLIVFGDIFTERNFDIINSTNNSKSKIKIPKSIFDDFFVAWHYGIGNYIYAYDPEFTGYVGYRYNLITGEFEEYDLH